MYCQNWKHLVWFQFMQFYERGLLLHVGVCGQRLLWLVNLERFLFFCVHKVSSSVTCVKFLMSHFLIRKLYTVHVALNLNCSISSWHCSSWISFVRCMPLHITRNKMTEDAWSWKWIRYFFSFATDIVHVNNFFTGRKPPVTSQPKKHSHYQYLNNDENMISFSFFFVAFYRSNKIPLMLLMVQFRNVDQIVRINGNIMCVKSFKAPLSMHMNTRCASIEFVNFADDHKRFHYFLIVYFISVIINIYRMYTLIYVLSLITLLKLGWCIGLWWPCVWLWHYDFVRVLQSIVAQ